MEPLEDFLKRIAKDVRIGILDMLYHAGSGHPGGSLSCADILTTLYCHTMTDDDHFILSKGHCVPALYSVLGENGLLDKSLYKTLRHLGGLQGHPDRKTPGIEFNSGSLGQGFSFAIGKALGMKLNGDTGKVYTLLGDGELQEGMVWEGLMFAAHHKLDNIVAIVDYNKLQSDALNSKIMGLEPLADKFTAFGWTVVEVDGHNFNELLDAFRYTVSMNKPVMIIANTVKGKGVSFMEGIPKFHGSYKLSEEELKTAKEEINA